MKRLQRFESQFDTKLNDENHESITVVFASSLSHGINYKNDDESFSIIKVISVQTNSIHT